jgi:hypothetical protein
MSESRDRVRALFTAEEDAALSEIVLAHPEMPWAEVAGRLPGRSARQCRERWNNYVNPEVSSVQWSAEEDARLLESVRELGNVWARHTRSFPGRSRNALLNRYRKLQKSNGKRRSKKKRAPSQHFQDPGTDESWSEFWSTGTLISSSAPSD